MSLLMDALKKAELAKHQGEGAGGAAGLTLEPLPGATAAEPAASPGASEASLPRLPERDDDFDTRFAAGRPSASARPRMTAQTESDREPRLETAGANRLRPNGAAEARSRPNESPSALDQAAAQNLFAAKQGEQQSVRKGFALIVGVVTILAVGGIGGYFWWQLQPSPGLLTNRPAAPQLMASLPVTAAPRPPPPAAAPVAAPAAPAPLTPPTAPPVVELANPAPAALPSIRKEDPGAGRRAGRRPAAPIDAEDGPVRVTRLPLQVNPALLRGFEAFNRGDLALAQIEYERARKSDPHNTDALHGLAAVALRQGRPDQAELLYRQIAEADPQDAVALAALINGRAPVDPGAAESRLKTLAAAQPELAAPHFSLGNLYARYGRWNEAQQAYFRAYSAEPDNPDILYNLAISLEHLRQNKLAAQYYGQALAAARTRTAGFDPAQASARLQTLLP